MARSATVVAMTENSEGHCLCLWDRQARALVRPIPDDRGGFGGLFWKELPSEELAVGSQVAYTPIGRGAETDPPHQQDDVVCELNAVGPKDRTSQACLHAQLSPSAHASLDTAWAPEIRINGDRSLDARAAGDAGARSFALVEGCVLRFFGARSGQASPLRADVHAGGRLLRDIPCTSTALRSSPGKQAQVVDCNAILVLGLARPRNVNKAADEHPQCQILLIGVIANPKALKMHADDPLLQAHVFLLHDRPEDNDDTKPGTYIQSFCSFFDKVELDLPTRTAIEGPLMAALGSMEKPEGDGRSLSLALREDGLRTLYFAGHCCSLVVKIEGEHAHVFALEPRISEYSRHHGLVDDYQGATVEFKKQLVTPTVAIETEATRFDEAVCDHICLLLGSESPVPEDTREPRSPILVFEWLLAQLQGKDACITASRKTVFIEEEARKLEEEKSSKGNLQRRSQHFMMLKFVIHHVLRHHSGLDKRRAGVVYKTLMVRYLLWLCQRQLDLLALTSSDQSTFQVIQLVMEMLAKVAHKAAKLARRGEDVRDLKQHCENIRKSVEDVHTHRLRRTADLHTLPGLEELDVERAEFEMPDKLASKIEAPSKPEESQSDKRLLASQNLRLCELPPQSLSLFGVRLWMEFFAKNKSSADKQMLMRHFEAFIFSLELTEMSSEDVCHLHDMTMQYLKVMASFKERLQVEQHSLVTLVVWVVMVLSFLAARRAYSPQMDSYGVPIKKEALRNLVLPDRAAMRCAERLHTQLGRLEEACPLFSMRPSEEFATLSFAQLFAARDSGMTALRVSEAAAAQGREQRYNAEVLRRSELARQLKRDFESASRDYQNAPYRSGAEYSARHRMNRLENELRSAQEPPDPVIQPLPRGESSALQVIFFLQMPQQLRQVAHLSMLAQQCLSTELSPSIGEEELTEAHTKLGQDHFKTNFAEFYSGRGGICKAELEATDVILMSTAKPPSVNALRGSANPIWYPDNLPQCLGWRFNGNFVNPYSVHEKTTLELFVKTLPSHAKSMQWMMPLPSTPHPDRSNLVYTRQCQAPQWLDKMGFLTFGELRAWPNQQIRKILIMLRERSLPLTEPVVHCLVEQALYQLGPQEDGALAWKADLESNEWLTEAMESLCGLADELLQKPRDHAALLILGRIAAYFVQWDSKLGKPCRELARVAQGWAQQLDSQMAEAVSDPKFRDQLRARRCLFQVYALLAYATLDPSVEDAEAWFGLTISVREALVFDAPEWQPEVNALMLRVESVAAQRIHIFLDKVSDAMLTRLLLRVVSDVADTAGIQWTRQGRTTACFEASHSGHMYHINLLHGIVLVDGLPLNRLPDPIVDDKLFQRTFGEARFEVTHGDGWFRTAREVDGCMYDFAMTERGLRVLETDTATKRALELLPHDECQMLPPLLRNKHSHWLHRESEAILLRGVEFRNKGESFLVRYHGKQCVCLRVPEHGGRTTSVLQDPQTQELEEQLVPTYDAELQRLVSILAKFENEAYMHIFVRRGNTRVWRIQFPRFKLTFELDAEGMLQSQEFRGYHASVRQQLPTTMPSFSQYLVLERNPGADAQLALFKVVAPQGEIATGVPVTVKPWDKFGHRYVYFSVDDGFEKLTAESVESRLHLAGLYAAASARLPDRFACLTGLEQAMVLARQSWKQVPFNESEWKSLEGLRALSSKSRPPGQHTEALELLCLELRASSRATAFLHSESGKKDKEDKLDHDLVRDYWRRKLWCGGSRRCALTDEEEEQFLGCKLGVPSKMEDHAPMTVWTQHAQAVLFDKRCLPGEFENHMMQAFRSDLKNLPSAQDALEDLCQVDEWPQGWLGAYSHIQDELAGRSPTLARSTRVVLSRCCALNLALSGDTLSWKWTLACALWLLAKFPHLFPAIPFRPNFQSIPGTGCQTISQGEIEGIVRRHISDSCRQQHTEDYWDYQARRDRTGNDAAASTWAAFRAFDLDVSGRPNKEPLFTDFAKSHSFGFASHYSCQQPGSQEAWKEIESLYRSRSLAIGLDGFLKQVAVAALQARAQAHAAQIPYKAQPEAENVDHLVCSLVPDITPRRCDVSRDSVEDKEDRLASLYSAPPSASDCSSIGVPAFPLDLLTFKSRMSEDIIKELRDSWHQHHAQAHGPSSVSPTVKEECEQLQADVDSDLSKVKQYLQETVRALPDDLEGLALGIERSAHLAPTPTLAEILRAVLPEASQLNPFLTSKGCKRLTEGVFCFLQLLVLREKLGRILSWMAAGPQGEAFVLQELQATRTWNPDEHPAWLLFEAEQRLQIRPAQRDVAMHLIGNPGEVMQLNMGEGKTRVIVPMLLLHWTSLDVQRMVRVNVLSTLLGEMYEYLHRVLGGLLNRRVYVLPFHRSVDITGERLQRVERQMLQCRQGLGVLLCAPEHRLSMQLKYHELHRKESFDGEPGELRKDLGRVLQVPTRELLDESDEILRHKYQLIYAVGSMVPLASGSVRWDVCHLLLRYIQDDAQIREWLDAVPKAAVSREPVNEAGDVMHEAFRPLRFLAGPELEAVMKDLRPRLSELAFEGKSFEGKYYEFRFLQKWAKHPEIRRFVKDAEMSEKEVPERVRQDEQLWPAVLALRGLLAFGVLQHALLKRHRVDYGVNPQGAKRLAVPFRAKDTPSERSEFGHPDMALVLTYLSYYQDGLHEKQVREAFSKLLDCGLNERADIYNAWYARSSKRMSPATRKNLSSVEKIDISNSEQLSCLAEHFGRNMETVGFWLTQCVFPAETAQFTQRLVANAWHLAEGSDVHGFSGTKDNHRTLPLQLKLRTLPKLQGTDGKMVQILLANPEYVEVPPSWEKILEVATKHQALIDAGALMTGVDNRRAAERTLELRRDLPGVVFFDDRRKKGWTVLDRFKRPVPEQQSAVRPKECFAYYDQSRSRGADLKLSQSAKACVTLGTAMCKDALMQACGRMRMLDKGQTLIFLGTPEITQKIKAACDCKDEAITSKEILQWVVKNTITSMDDALIEWARQGASFASTKDATRTLLECQQRQEPLARVCTQDEVLELRDFYGFSMHQRCSAAVVRAHLDEEVRRVSSHLEHPSAKDESCASVKAQIMGSMKDIQQRIAETTDHYCSESWILASGFDEEYERELEKQVEQERERELPPPQKARAEEDWAWSKVFDRGFFGRCRNGAGPLQLMRIEEMFQRTASMSGIDVKFPAALWASRNFAEVLASQSEELDKFLRTVDAVLTFAVDGTVQGVLISPREADHLLPLFRKASKVASDDFPQLQHFTLLKAGKHHLTTRLRATASRRWFAASFVPPHRIHPSFISVLQLFMGECMFDAERIEKVREFLCLGGRIRGDGAGAADEWHGRKLAEALVAVRGRLHFFTRSDLDRLLSE